MYIVETIIGITRLWLDISNEWVTDKARAWKYAEEQQARQDADHFGGYIVPA